MGLKCDPDKWRWRVYDRMHLRNICIMCLKKKESMVVHASYRLAMVYVFFIIRVRRIRGWVKPKKKTHK